MNVFPASVYRANFFVSTSPDEVAPKVNINVRSTTDQRDTSALMLTMRVEEALSLGQDLINQALSLSRGGSSYDRLPPGLAQPVRGPADYSPSKASQAVYAAAVDIPADRSDFTKDDEATGT